MHEPILFLDLLKSHDQELVVMGPHWVLTRKKNNSKQKNHMPKTEGTTT